MTVPILKILKENMSVIMIDGIFFVNTSQTTSTPIGVLFSWSGGATPPSERVLCALAHRVRVAFAAQERVELARKRQGVRILAKRRDSEKVRLQKILHESAGFLLFTSYLFTLT